MLQQRVRLRTQDIEMPTGYRLDGSALRPRVSVADRLWAKVDKLGAVPPIEGWSLGPCWLWTGRVSSVGRGSIGLWRADGSFGQELVHRVAWELVNGPIPAEMFVLHKCDIGRCCNPVHLYLGTQTENMEDRSTRGRHHSRIGRPITREIVLLIREQHAAGIQQRAIAKEFDLTFQQVSHIVNKLAWSHV